MILCAGESLIDFIGEEGKGMAHSEFFRPRVGGSPLNTAVGLSRLSVNVAFLTKVGNDYFGEKIRKFLREEKVLSKYIFISQKRKTPIAFIALSKNKVPEYEFYRVNTSDLDINETDIGKIDYKEIKLFHFGSISLINGNTADSLVKIFKEFKKRKVITSLDPNVRENLIEDKKKYIHRLIDIMRDVDILKLSMEDLNFFFQEGDFEKFIKFLGRENKLTFLTLGEKGSLGFYQKKLYKMNARKIEKIVDTTGCGDAYMVGILYKIYEYRTLQLSESQIYEIMEFSSLLSSITASNYGGATSMPFVSDCLKYGCFINK